MSWPDDMDDEIEATRQQGQFLKGVGKGVYEGGKSMVEGAWDLAKGGYALATDSAARDKAWETTKALAEKGKDYAKSAYDDPAKAWKDAKNGANALYSAFDKARQEAAERGESAEFWGKAVGRAGFEIGALLVPVGKVAQAGKLGEAAKLGKLAEAANAAGKTGEIGSTAARAADAVAAPAMGVIDSCVEVLPCGKVIRRSEFVATTAVKAEVALENIVVAKGNVVLKAERIAKGSSEKIAVIGRSMGDANKAGVKDLANAIEKYGKKVEIFDGPQISKEAFEEWDFLKRKHAPNWIPNEEVLRTKMFAENTAWAKKLKEEGYTIIDMGNPYGDVTSPFYEMEKKILFPEDSLVDQVVTRSAARSALEAARQAQEPSSKGKNHDD